MSVFSKIKLSKKAAKAHKTAGANKENEQPVVPYRHVPKHAASDAMSGCPQAWVELNREKIVAHNKRNSKAVREAASIRREAVASRAESIRSGSSSGKSVGGVSQKSFESRIVMDGLPKNSLNNAYFQSFPKGSQPASSASSSSGKTPLPRAMSSQSFSIGAYHGNSYGSTTRMRRGLSYQDSAIGRSPLSSQVNSADHSRVNSSGNSTISSENLEMAMPSSSRQRPHLQNRYTLPASGSGIKRNTSDPKISSALRSSVMNADSLPTTPAPVVVKQGPMAVAPVVSQPQKIEEKQKRRMSFFGSKKKAVVAAAA